MFYISDSEPFPHIFLHNCSIILWIIWQFISNTTNSQGKYNLENIKGLIKNGHSREIGNIGYTIQDKQSNKTTQKTQNRCTTWPSPNNRRWTQVLAKGKQFLLLIRHPPCYSYIQSSPVKVLAVRKERKHLRKKEKIHCHLRSGERVFKICSIWFDMIMDWYTRWRNIYHYTIEPVLTYVNLMNTYVVQTGHSVFMKKTFKQRWATMAPESTKWTITSHFNSLYIEKDHDIWR